MEPFVLVAVSAQTCSRLILSADQQQVGRQKIRRHKKNTGTTAATRCEARVATRSKCRSVGSGPAAADQADSRAPASVTSDLGVALHVQRLHLVEDERDGVLSDDAHVSSHR